ncbi:MAG: glycosyl transferase [Aphanizomenon flos-aquae MDT14a]|uniref:Glycosyl transferase n=1 Tax=Aphanizomenon flos-aquae LD13 TaxID=1710894 RepID=A0A1B7VZZ4_APHFL|nr:MAG: glycosyl transferase [Aphanizomenon flos-aquae LD13]OBQ31493.1 MAG: glycosyl transferase [Aphanizomenon flos-aquae MDT14a]
MQQVAGLYPKITVVMPVYNGEKYLDTAIKSILNQKFTNFEFVIVDDASTDNSVEIINSYQDQRIKLIKNNVNLGIPTTRNKCLQESSGEYVAVLDCDDYAYPSRLAEQLEFMENNPDFGMVGSWVELIDENDDLTGEVWNEDEPSQKIPCRLLFHNYFAHSAVLLRRSALDTVKINGEIYRKDYPNAQDYDLWVRISKKFKVWNIPKVLIKYRVHSHCISLKSANLVEQLTCKIVTEQMNNLGIQPTDKQLALHRQIGSYNPQEIDTSIEYIKEVANWLTILRNANKNTGVYDHHNFNQVLADLQLSMFCHCLKQREIEFT